MIFEQRPKPGPDLDGWRIGDRRLAEVVIEDVRVVLPEELLERVDVGPRAEREAVDITFGQLLGGAQQLVAVVGAFGLPSAPARPASWKTLSFRNIMYMTASSGRA